MKDIRLTFTHYRLVHPLLTNLNMKNVLSPFTNYRLVRTLPDMLTMKKLLLAVLVVVGGVALSIGFSGCVTARQSETESLFKGAKWIQHPVPPYAQYPGMPVFRKKFFSTGGKITLAICGLGQYVATLNGKPLADREVLTSGWTLTEKTCLYDVWTPEARFGENVLEITLGNGFYNVPKTNRYAKLITDLRTPKLLVGGDVVSDETWETAFGDIIFSTVFGGDDKDARLTGKEEWGHVEITSSPGGELLPSTFHVRTFDTVEPVKIYELAPDRFIYDFGLNASYIPTFKVKGEEGASVKAIFAEWLVQGKDGGKPWIEDSACGGGSSCTYILRGDEAGETYTPPFFYRGYRYARVELTPAKKGGALPKLEAFTSKTIHADVRKAGSFECSVPLFNQIRDIIVRAQESNMVSVFTDCPHREKLGWQEQYNAHSDQIRWEWNADPVYAKGCRDMADSQTEKGLVPDIAPEFTLFPGGFRDSVEWGSSMILVPWQQYEWSGDTSLIQTYYPNMKAYFEYLVMRSRGGISHGGLGDWLSIPSNGGGAVKYTPSDLTSTAYFYKNARVMEACARMLNKPEDAEQFRKQADETLVAFNAKWWNEQKGYYASDSQASNAIAIDFGLATGKRAERAGKSIVADLASRGNNLTAGEVCYPYLLKALSAAGRNDVIYAMSMITDSPGFGYMIKFGETSLPETWNCARGLSHNHYMMGDIIDWYYSELAGIKRLSPGFKRVAIRPDFVKGVDWVKASYIPVGFDEPIEVAWTRKDKTVELSVAIPKGMEATIELPGKEAQPAPQGERTVVTFEVP